jgi:hypothetical protein
LRSLPLGLNLKIVYLEDGHFMYRRPILCTLYGAVDFLKVLKIAVVGGGGGVSRWLGRSV